MPEATDDGEGDGSFGLSFTSSGSTKSWLWSAVGFNACRFNRITLTINHPYQLTAMILSTSAGERLFDGSLLSLGPNVGAAAAHSDAGWAK